MNMTFINGIPCLEMPLGSIRKTLPMFNAFIETIHGDWKYVILDMSKVKNVTDEGMNQFFRLANILNNRGGGLIMFGLHQTTLCCVEELGFDRIITILDSQYAVEKFANDVSG